MEEFRALRDLMLLYDEGATDETLSSSLSYNESQAETQAQVPIQPINRFKWKSRQFPDLLTCPAFLHQSIIDLKKKHGKKIPPNLNRRQMQALKSLQKRTDMVVKPSDKGGNIVKMTQTHYQAMCHTILDNHKWYRPIPLTFIQTFAGELRDLCMGAYLQGLINRDTLDFLIPKFPRTPNFYVLPKTHKNVHAPPGRLIASGIGSLTNNASKFVDAFLMPHVSWLPSFIRDTTDLLKHIEGIQVPPYALLMAIDIEALYWSIPHGQGVWTAGSFLMEREQTSWPLNQFILQLLLFILTKNYLICNDQYYLDSRSRYRDIMCSLYANLYLGGWERVITSEAHLSPFLTTFYFGTDILMICL